MIRRFFSGKQLMLVVCLLLTVGILFLGNSSVSYAMEEDDILTERESNLTGTTQDRTNINDPGTSENADELRELNIANSVTVTYDNGNGTIAGPIRILITLTMLSLAPFLLIMLTSFTRIIIVLHFVRNAIGTQTAPPNQVLVGLALFLTLFIMYPVFGQINEEAIKPLDAGEITQEEAFTAAMQPIRNFMYPEIHEDDVVLMCDIAGLEAPENLEEMDELPMRVIIPSFILSELRAAFIIGFFIYIPFIVIDMVVASVLMSMGMMMLPPTTISLPFKILLFVLADGWNLVIGNLVRTFL